MPEDKKKQGTGPGATTTNQQSKRGYSVLNRSTSKKVTRYDSPNNVNGSQTCRELAGGESPKGTLKRAQSKKYQNIQREESSPRSSGGKSPRSEEEKQKHIEIALSSWGTQADMNTANKKNKQKPRKMDSVLLTSSSSRRRSLDGDEMDGLGPTQSDPGGGGSVGTVQRMKAPPKKDGGKGVFNTKAKTQVKRRGSITQFTDADPRETAFNAFLQIDFKTHDPSRTKELLENLAHVPPAEDDTLFLGLIRQMCDLFDISPCKERRFICETLTKLKPSKLAFQILLLLAANTSDSEGIQRKAANLLTSFVAQVYYAPDFVGGRGAFDEIMKESEYLVWIGIHDSSPFIQSSLASMKQLIDFVPLSTQINQATASEEAIKREFEKKMNEGSFILLGWLLCCMNEFSKLIVEDSKITDTILEALKKETGILKALALVALFRLYMSAKFKTSSSLLQEIADQSQDQTIKNLATALKSAQKKKVVK